MLSHRSNLTVPPNGQIISAIERTRRERDLGGDVPLSGVQFAHQALTQILSSLQQR